MIRTQIYLPEQVHRQLHRLAAQQSMPMAGVIRAFVEQGLQKTQKKDTSGKDALQAVISIKAKGRDRKLSSHINDYLYGSKKHEE